MSKFTGYFNFELRVEADTIEEADKKLRRLLEDVSGSNDGSEILANSKLDAIEEQ